MILQLSMFVIAVILSGILFYNYSRENYLSLKYASPGTEGTVYTGYLEIGKKEKPKKPDYSSPGTEEADYTGDYLNIIPDDKLKDHKYDDGDYDRFKQRRAIGQRIDA